MKILRNFKFQIWKQLKHDQHRIKRKAGIALETILIIFKYLKESLVPLKLLLCQ